jgi:hypothetical protein
MCSRCTPHSVASPVAVQEKLTRLVLVGMEGTGRLWHVAEPGLAAVGRLMGLKVLVWCKVGVLGSARCPFAERAGLMWGCWPGCRHCKGAGLRCAGVMIWVSRRAAAMARRWQYLMRP